MTHTVTGRFHGFGGELHSTMSHTVLRIWLNKSFVSLDYKYNHQRMKMFDPKPGAINLYSTVHPRLGSEIKVFRTLGADPL